jgi:hypothetical protein
MAVRAEIRLDVVAIMAYLAFGFMHGHARGGLKDLIGDYDTVENASQAIEEAAQDNLAGLEYYGTVVQVSNDTLTPIRWYKAYSKRDKEIASFDWLDHDPLRNLYG